MDLSISKIANHLFKFVVDIVFAHKRICNLLSSMIVISAIMIGCYCHHTLVRDALASL